MDSMGGGEGLFIWGIQTQTEEPAAKYTVPKEGEEIVLGLPPSHFAKEERGMKVQCLAQGHGRTKIQIFPFLEPTIFMDSCPSSTN